MMTKNIVISALSAKYVHQSLAPFCLLSGIKAYCKTPCNTKIVNATINEDLSEIEGRILEQNPHILGLCAYIWNIDKTLSLAKSIKSESPETVIVLGGPEVSYRAQDVLQIYPFVDFVISGEGERPFAELIDCLYCGENFDKINGLCYRDNADIIINPPCVMDSDPPSPYGDDYISQVKGKIAYIETSRGCPYSCAFCLSGRCGKARFFDLEKSKENILSLANSGAKVIKFVDRTFNANRKRANEIFKFIIDNKGKAYPDDICFHFEIAGDLIDESNLEILSKAPLGLIQMEIGLQSFNSETLIAINRKTDMKRLIKNIKSLIALSNIHIHIDLIAGLPYEDLNSFKDSFNTAFYLNPHMLQLGFLKLLYGSPMREEPEKFPCEYSENAPYEVISTPWISSDDLQKIHYVEDALERLYNSGRFKSTLKYILEKINRTPFEVFADFGEFCITRFKSSPSLDEYIELIFEFFCKNYDLDKSTLRDLLVSDFLSTNSQGRLPKILQIEDDFLRKAKIYINNKFPLKKGVKRAVALLYNPCMAVFVDYENKNPVTGKYKLNKVNISFDGQTDN